MKVIKQELKELFFLTAMIFFIGLVALCVSCYVITTNTAITYPIEIWINGCTVVDFFLPLLVTAPFSIILYMKRKERFIEYAAVRMSKSKYVRYQVLSGMLMSASVTFLIYFIALLLSIFVFFKESNYDDLYLYEYLFGSIQAEKPVLFGVFWCIWKGLIASLFTWFGYRLSLCLDNLFAITIIPFIYVMAENLVTGVLQLSKYSIMTSYVLNRLSPEAVKIRHLFIGVISYLIITTIVIFIIKCMRRKEYEEAC